MEFIILNLNLAILNFLAWFLNLVEAFLGGLILVHN